MEKDDLNRDDFLGRLIRQGRTESPSDDFVERVMAGITTAPDGAPVKKPLFQYLKSGYPYAILIAVFIVVFSSSDLPFLQWLPGRSYYMNNLVPYFGTLFDGLKNAFSSRFVSFGIMVAVSGGLLFLVDRIFSRKTTV
jgi:hypothetical protein